SDSYVRLGRSNPLTAQLMTDATTISLLNQASGLTADPNRFDENELETLVAAGKLPSMPPSIPPGVVYANPGDTCDPDDTPPTGYVCEPTAAWVAQPSEILNAFKGYFIMDHGCG